MRRNYKSCSRQGKATTNAIGVRPVLAYTSPVWNSVLGLTLMFRTLCNIFCRRHFEISSYFFPDNNIWHFMQIVSWRQFAWNVKSCFLWKIRQKSPIFRLRIYLREWYEVKRWQTCQNAWTAKNGGNALKIDSMLPDTVFSTKFSIHLTLAVCIEQSARHSMKLTAFCQERKHRQNNIVSKFSTKTYILGTQ